MKHKHAEVIKAHLEGVPIEIKFLCGANVWEPFPDHWKGLSAFDMGGYAFRIAHIRVPVVVTTPMYGEHTVSLSFKNGVLVKRKDE